MTIPEIFAQMPYGPAPEDDAPAQDWLGRHDRRFGHWIGGGFTVPRDGLAVTDPATGAQLAEITPARQEEVEAAIAAARAAQPGWAALPGHARARCLYALSRQIQKNARLFAVLETLDSGKPIRESRDIDVPLAARHVLYHAGMAQLMASELPDRAPLGVCAQIVPWNFPLLMAAWKIAPALAMGNTTVLKPAEWTPLTALLLAEISHEAGLPPGVLNVVTGAGDVGRMLVAAEGIDKIAFTGSTEVGREIRRATAGRGRALTLELGGKSPFVVFDDADLDSAVEGVVDAIWFNGGQVCCAGSRLLLQEGIAAPFTARLKARMAKLRVGRPLDKGVDMGAMVHADQKARVLRHLQAAERCEVFTPETALPAEGAFLPPMLVTGLDAAHPLMREEIFGPVLVAASFRTPAEAVALANDTTYGLAASVWSENINLALGVAPQIAAGVVWINGTNLLDAAAGFGGMRESGFGREGGWEGLAAYTRPAEAPATAPPWPGGYGPGAPTPEPVGAVADAAAPAIDRTAKLYIGGKQARPDGGYSLAVTGADGRRLGEVGLANRKDVRNAVEAARKAQGPWAAKGGPARSQILYYLAENLAARQDQIATRLGALLDDTAAAAAETEAAIARLFTYAAWADKFDGAVKDVPQPGLALALQRPVGVVGALCPAGAPLLGLVSLLAPALAMGNACIAVASEPFPLAATDFYQVLDTSDVPPGVANVLTGRHAELAPILAAHHDVDAVWAFSDPDLAGPVEAAAAGNLKRTWTPGAIDLHGAAGEGRAFLRAACEVQTVWIPYGEG